MNDMFTQVLVTTLYLLALINPISKVSVLSALAAEGAADDFKKAALESTLVAAGILIIAMIFGDFLLRTVFRVDLHSLRFSGGAVLFWVGFNALRKGIFFEQDTKSKFKDLAVVPLACPLIAGPATIAACITLRSSEGAKVSVLAVIIALMVNHLIMLGSKPIAALLSKFNVMGAMIRITGLIVMTIGSKMALDGLGAWLLETIRATPQG